MATMHSNCKRVLWWQPPASTPSNTRIVTFHFSFLQVRLSLQPFLRLSSLHWFGGNCRQDWAESTFQKSKKRFWRLKKMSVLSGKGRMWASHLWRSEHLAQMLLKTDARRPSVFRESLVLMHPWLDASEQLRQLKLTVETEWKMRHETMKERCTKAYMLEVCVCHQMACPQQLATTLSIRRKK